MRNVPSAEIYPTNDRSVPPQAGDLELLEGARLSKKQIAARAQVSSWHKACPKHLRELVRSWQKADVTSFGSCVGRNLLSTLGNYNSA